MLPLLLDDHQGRWHPLRPRASTRCLKEGEEIVAATAEGTLTTDTVSLLSIAKPEAHAKSLLALRTAANTTLILTPEHHVPIGETCCSTLKKAKDVAVGDTAWTVKDGAVAATAITAISKANGRGLHSPVLTHGGSLTAS